MRNFIKLSVTAGLILTVLGACSGDKARHEAAMALVEKAQQLSDGHRYDSALVVLDTLNIKYRDCIDERKKGTMVRLEALSALTRDSIAVAELQLRAISEEVDRLAPEFKKVEIEGTDGYFVDKNTYTGNEMTRNGIQVRIDDQGYCFIIANVAGKRIGLNSISYNNISTPPVNSIEVEGSEIMSVTQEPAVELLNALSDADGKAAVNLVGSKGTVKVELSAKEVQSIGMTWRYALAVQQSRALNIRLEKLERQLARLSDQIAAQTPVDSE